MSHSFGMRDKLCKRVECQLEHKSGGRKTQNLDKLVNGISGLIEILERSKMNEQKLTKSDRY